MRRTANAVATACTLAVLLATLSAAPPARAQGAPASEVDACANAAEESQPLRTAGKLTRAREKILVCARPVCPAAIRSDCAKWLAEVDAVMPTIVLRVVDPAGKDLTQVRVSVDGAVLTDKLDGRPISIDPGEHTFTFESAGHKPLTEKLLIRQGEKVRLVSASFAPVSDKPAGNARTTDGATEPRREWGGIPTISWVLGGVGLVGVGVGVGMWASGTSDHSEMKSGCARTQSCLQADVDSAETKLVVGDVAMVLGLGAIGAGVLFAVFSKKPATTSVVDVKPVAGGGMATVGSRF